MSATADPGAVVFNGTGTNLIGTQVGPDDGPSGGAFRPTDPAQRYVVNAHAGPNPGSAPAYAVNADGTLRSIGASPYPNRQTAPCGMAITPDGRSLFTINPPVSSVSRYEILADGSLKLLGSTTVNDPTGLHPTEARIDPRGEYLYVLGADAGVVSSFAVDGGTLTELPTSPVALPEGTTPFGIAVV